MIMHVGPDDNDWLADQIQLPPIGRHMIRCYHKARERRMFCVVRGAKQLYPAGRRTVPCESQIDPRSQACLGGGLCESTTVNMNHVFTVAGPSAPTVSSGGDPALLPLVWYEKGTRRAAGGSELHVPREELGIAACSQVPAKDRRLLVASRLG